MILPTYLYQMPESFSKRISIDGKMVLAAVLPQQRPDGMYYEINIKGYPRFYMTWSVMDRYDIEEGSEVSIPYNVILAVSDAIEKEIK